MVTTTIKFRWQSTVVDLGSGTGKFLPYLQQVSSHIIAVEPITEMLTQLQQVYPQISTLQASSDRLSHSEKY